MNLRISLPAIAIAGAIGAATAVAQPDTTYRPSQRDTMAGRLTPEAVSGTDASPRPWYDTLTVTRPRYARVAPWERLALSAFTALAIPIGLSVATLTVLPPTVNVVSRDGELHGGISVSTGMGFGGDRSSELFFPDYRVQVEGAYFFGIDPGPRISASILADLPVASLSRYDALWFGMAGGGGIATDFQSVSPFAEGWIGVLNPMGTRFLTFFPMHNYGLRGRAGYDITNGRMWYELSLSATSTFW